MLRRSAMSHPRQDSIAANEIVLVSKTEALHPTQGSLAAKSNRGATEILGHRDGGWSDTFFLEPRLPQRLCSMAHCLRISSRGLAAKYGQIPIRLGDWVCSVRLICKSKCLGRGVWMWSRCMVCIANWSLHKLGVSVWFGCMVCVAN